MYLARDCLINQWYLVGASFASLCFRFDATRCYKYYSAYRAYSLNKIYYIYFFACFYLLTTFMFSLNSDLHIQLPSLPIFFFSFSFLYIRSTLCFCSFWPTSAHSIYYCFWIVMWVLLVLVLRDACFKISHDYTVFERFTPNRTSTRLCLLLTDLSIFQGRTHVLWATINI